MTESPLPPSMPTDSPPPPPDRESGPSFRRFFWRGLAIILPTVLTFWVLMVVYNFVQNNVAAPINWGIREVLLATSDWPQPTNEDLLQGVQRLPASGRHELEDLIDRQRAARATITGGTLPPRSERQIAIDYMIDDPGRFRLARRVAMERQWNGVRLLGIRAMDLIGLLVAIIAIYFVGVFISNYIGRRIYRRLEQIVHQVPLVSKVYPAVKQVTDFLFGQDANADGDGETGNPPIQFNRVVIVQYPSKGIWSLGLVTGSTLKRVTELTHKKTISVFIPNSPTPFTGFVINVPESEAVDVPITIEEALKFVVSGGVLIPPSQQTGRETPPLPGFETAENEENDAARVQTATVDR